MASFVLLVFTILLLPVERSAKAATCYECFIDGGGYCNGVQKNCTNQQTCLGVYSAANLSLDHRITTSFSRSCVDPSNHLTGSFYLDFGNDNILDFNSQLCNESDPQCSLSLAGNPMRNYENGKYCPKCFRTGYDNCDDDGEVFCVGDLVNCTEVKGQITHRFSDITIPFAGKGCVSRSVCNIGGKSIQRGSYKLKFNEVQCSEANGAFSTLRRLAFTLEKKDLGPQASFFFPCILGIFAVKILS
ncbi:uncharacterized protein LOC120317631 [Crotalus tigris]|uniref:uncharacterized protein LOC120317631 n=1 Tax=Crotalus tigris TaxID=88082 RepID=UPI00192F1A80|nr:uncharacterized protein LOC120317631 [Crotalus tigris]